jgi:Fe2+ transport system protein B
MTACHGVEALPVAIAGVRRVALVGSPNAGKTSVFNHLTGLRAKTGNYPGVTVGRSVGTTHVDDVRSRWCMSTIAVMRRETNSWRWPAVAFSYMFVLAWVMAFAARTIAIGLGV